MTLGLFDRLVASAFDRAALHRQADPPIHAEHMGGDPLTPEVRRALAVHMGMSAQKLTLLALHRDAEQVHLLIKVRRFNGATHYAVRTLRGATGEMDGPSLTGTRPQMTSEFELRSGTILAGVTVQPGGRFSVESARSAMEILVPFLTARRPVRP